MPGDSYATRREIDQLRAEVRRLQEQLSQVEGSSKVTAQHLQAHEEAQRERTEARRWAIGIAFAALGALSGVYLMLIDLLSHAH